MTAALWVHDLTDTPVATACAGDRAALVGSDGEVLLVAVGSGDFIAARRFESGALGAALDPNGRNLVVHGPFGSSLWDTESDQVTQLADGWGGDATWANSQRAAVADERVVLVVDQDGTVLWRSDQFPSTVTSLAWLGGWRRLAVAAYGGVQIVEPRPRGQIRLCSFKGSLLDMDTDPNGRWIVSGNQDSTLQVFRSDDETRLEMQGFPSKITKVAFDASGSWLANNGAPELAVWDFAGPGPSGRAPALLVAQGDESGETAVSGDEPRIADFAWQPSAPTIAVAWEDGNVTRYDVSRAAKGNRNPPDAVICRLESTPSTLAWPTPARIIVGCSDGQVACFSAG